MQFNLCWVTHVWRVVCCMLYVVFILFNAVWSVCCMKCMMYVVDGVTRSGGICMPGFAACWKKGFLTRICISPLDSFLSMTQYMRLSSKTNPPSHTSFAASQSLTFQNSLKVVYITVLPRTRREWLAGLQDDIQHLPSIHSIKLEEFQRE